VDHNRELIGFTANHLTDIENRTVQENTHETKHNTEKANNTKYSKTKLA